MQGDAADEQVIVGLCNRAIKDEGRLDVFFANAGIGERMNFYERHDTGEDPPPQPSEWKRITDICLTGVFSTAYLAVHYFRLSPESTKGNRNIVITASCGAEFVNGMHAYRCFLGGSSGD